MSKIFCIKEHFSFMSVNISGPRNYGNEKSTTMNKGLDFCLCYFLIQVGPGSVKIIELTLAYNSKVWTPYCSIFSIVMVVMCLFSCHGLASKNKPTLQKIKMQTQNKDFLVHTAHCPNSRQLNI